MEYDRQDVDTLLILGTSEGMWDDVAKAKGLAKNHHVLCINDAAIHYPAVIHHIVSLHGPFCGALRTIKMAGRLYDQKEPPVTHSDKDGEGIDCKWRFMNVGGTSALLSCQIAMDIGYEKIILCGCPLDGTPHYWDDPNKKGVLDCGAIHMTWRDAIPKLKDKVRSMSGKTKEFLGETTADWLNDIGGKHE